MSSFDPRRHPRGSDGKFEPAPPAGPPDAGLAADLADPPPSPVVLSADPEALGDRRRLAEDAATPAATLAVLAAQTEAAPRPPDSDDPDVDDWWYEHGETWVKNTATSADLERVANDYWDDGYGVPAAIAKAVYRDDCPTEVVDAVLAGAHLPRGGDDVYGGVGGFSVGEDTGRAARHPNRPADWADSVARGLCSGRSFTAGFLNQFDSPDRQRGLKNPVDTAALLDALRHEGELADEAVVDVARHRNTPPETLARLAGDAFVDEAVRQSVAGNPSTPPEALSRLAADEDPAVRAAAASNPNTPPAGRAAAGLLAD